MTASSAPGSPLALADAARFSYGGEPILSDVSLAIVAGDALAVTGRSGSGKTTLLLMLAGLLAPTSGSVTWPGLDVDPDRRRARISLVFQAPSLMPELTASENVALPLRLRGASVAAARSATQDALAAVGLSEAGEALPAQLSGGMQQRVAVARALAAKPLLILADEPTGALDREAGAVVMSALRRHAAEAGGALLVATHDLDIAASFSERVELASGRLVMGSPT